MRRGFFLTDGGSTSLVSKVTCLSSMRTWAHKKVPGVMACICSPSAGDLPQLVSSMFSEKPLSEKNEVESEGRGCRMLIAGFPMCTPSAHEHTQEHIVLRLLIIVCQCEDTSLTSRGIRIGSLFWSQWLWPRNSDLGCPKFHVSLWEQFMVGFYGNGTKKVINQDSFQIRRWQHPRGGLQPEGENSSWA